MSRVTFHSHRNHRRRSLLLFLLTFLTFLLVAPAQTSANQTSTNQDSASLTPFIHGEAPQAMQLDAHFSNYRFRSGEVLPDLRLHYATLGTPHRNDDGAIDNAVLVIHWTGSDSSALLTPNYISALFAPGRPLDASRYYLIFPDNIGHGKSSKPSDGLKAQFPHYGYNDMVDLQYRLVTETLGIHHLHAILGMSMGGMNAWQWAEAYPDFVDGVMPVVSMPVPVSGRNLLWRRLVIDQIRSDPEYNNGNYEHSPRGWQHAYPIIRMMIDGVPHLQATVPNVEAADQLIATSAQQAAHVDANDVLYSLSSSADYNPEPNLASIRTYVYALNFDDDEFNPAQLHITDNLITRVPRGRFTLQPGSEHSFGHLTMAHPELWSDKVAAFLQAIETPSAQ